MGKHACMQRDSNTLMHFLSQVEDNSLSVYDVDFSETIVSVPLLDQVKWVCYTVGHFSEVQHCSEIRCCVCTYST